MAGAGAEKGVGGLPLKFLVSALTTLTTLTNQSESVNATAMCNTTHPIGYLIVPRYLGTMISKLDIYGYG